MNPKASTKRNNPFNVLKNKKCIFAPPSYCLMIGMKAIATSLGGLENKSGAVKRF
jgi:hypothetical protein